MLFLVVEVGAVPSIRTVAPTEKLEPVSTSVCVVLPRGSNAV